MLLQPPDAVGRWPSGHHPTASTENDMNKERRKVIARATVMIDEAKGILESCRDEEQEYYDNMPESFQNGEKGSTAQEAIDALEEAVSSLEEITGNISEFTA
jgi:hypothetical protein